MTCAQRRNGSTALSRCETSTARSPAYLLKRLIALVGHEHYGKLQVACGYTRCACAGYPQLDWLPTSVIAVRAEVVHDGALQGHQRAKRALSRLQHLLLVLAVACHGGLVLCSVHGGAAQR
eukprot:scaffold2645_cov378-Prasinococcus_capsulatus_cf.AAC.17